MYACIRLVLLPLWKWVKTQAESCLNNIRSKSLCIMAFKQWFSVSMVVLRSFQWQQWTHLARIFVCFFLYDKQNTPLATLYYAVYCSKFSWHSFHRQDFKLCVTDIHGTSSRMFLQAKKAKYTLKHLIMKYYQKITKMKRLNVHGKSQSLLHNRILKCDFLVWLKKNVDFLACFCSSWFPFMCKMQLKCSLDFKYGNFHPCISRGCVCAHVCVCVCVCEIVG